MLNAQDYQSLFHEIKNSICIIGSSLQLIEKQHPEVTNFSYWDDTLTYITNLRKLIIDFSSVKLSEKPEIKKVDIYEFLSNLESTVLPLFYENGSILFDTAADIPDTYFDALRMNHAIVNLIKNASEAMEATDTLVVRTYCSKDSLFFEIKDTGCGIPSEVLEQIFTPFFSSKKDGNGLGLTITKEIIESHGGTLTVSSVVEQGTTFTVSLPIVPKETR